MKIKVQLKDGLLPDKYTKHTSDNYQSKGRPFVSFPFQINEVPAGTKSLAFALTDLDSIPVCGFEWLHWIVAGVQPQTTLWIPENAGKTNPLNWTRGYNSLAGKLMNQKNNPLSLEYVGPTPPNGKHCYTLTVYALDTSLPLTDGFWYNELIHGMQGHIIEQSNINLPVNS